MDKQLFVEESYPDFSLLEEVLLPPDFDLDQTWGHVDEEWTKLVSERQCCQQPLGVAVVPGECSSNAITATQSRPGVEENLQYQRKASRGRRRRCTGRFSEGKAKKWGNSNYEHSKHRSSCIIQDLKPAVFHLLEESVRQLEKCIDTENDDQNVHDITSDSNQTSYHRDSFKIAKSPSCISSNALEILNHINMECALINKLGPGAEDMLLKASEGQNECSRYLEINNNIAKLDRACLSSISKEQSIDTSVDPKWTNTVSNCDPKLKKCPSNTSCEVQNVMKAIEQYQENLSEGSLNNGLHVQRTARKQGTPMRSVQKMDPGFQGIAFQMHLCFDKEKFDDCQLIVTSAYSRGRNRRKSTKSTLLFKSISLSSGSENDHPSSKNKCCASCKTQKTPMWRDADDGTPLCNACGIRYKKYGVKCAQCWNIPKRNGKASSSYCGCGGMFRALTQESSKK